MQQGLAAALQLLAAIPNNPFGLFPDEPMLEFDRSEHPIRQAVLAEAIEHRANRQAESISALAADAAAWVLTLTPQQARRKAAMTAKRFWLKSLLQHFWPPT